jgi:glycosyltransferase involved in cell wall biosynthesis
MKLAVVIPYFYPAYVYGGAVFAAYHLSQKISENGIEVDVLTTNSNGDKTLDVPTNKLINLNNLKVKYYDRGFLPFFSFKMILGLARDIKNADIVHIQSIYSLSTIVALFHSYLQNKKVFLSPRGSLTAWSFHHRGYFKRLWINFLIKPFVNDIHWHATSEKEINEIYNFFPKAKIELIPDGVDFDKSKIQEDSNQKWKNSYYIACLGRIHKIKGYDIMLNAMPEIIKVHPELKLFIAGMDEGELSNLKRLTVDLQIEENVEFVGALVSDDKNCFLKYAQCLVMPSHTENFGIVAAEALFQNTPVVASKNTPWKSLEEKHAGFHIDNTPKAIKESIVSLLADVESYSKNTYLVVEQFSWEKIAKSFKVTLNNISKN